jgi:hypothetical protein
MGYLFIFMIVILSRCCKQNSLLVLNKMIDSKDIINLTIASFLFYCLFKMSLCCKEIRRQNRNKCVTKPKNNEPIRIRKKKIILSVPLVTIVEDCKDLRKCQEFPIEDPSMTVSHFCLPTITKAELESIEIKIESPVEENKEISIPSFEGKFVGLAIPIKEPFVEESKCKFVGMAIPIKEPATLVEESKEVFTTSEENYLEESKEIELTEIILDTYLDTSTLSPLSTQEDFKLVSILPYSNIEEKIYFFLNSEGDITKIQRKEGESLIHTLNRVPICSIVPQFKDKEDTLHWFEKEKLLVLLLKVNSFPDMEKYGFICTTNIRLPLQEHMEVLIKEIEYQILGWDLL